MSEVGFEKPSATSYVTSINDNRFVRVALKTTSKLYAYGTGEFCWDGYKPGNQNGLGDRCVLPCSLLSFYYPRVLADYIAIVAGKIKFVLVKKFAAFFRTQVLAKSWSIDFADIFL